MSPASTAGPLRTSAGAVRVHRGRFAHAPAADTLQILDDTLIVVDDRGVITEVLEPDHECYARTLAEARDDGRLNTATGSAFWLPGLVDLHVHAPQWPQLGTALHLPLEDWLQRATFPLEARCADLDYADRIYRSLVTTLLAHGTTTAVYFATLHDAATQRLAELCLELGQRAVVGRVAMDHPDQCPDFYRDPCAEVALRGTEALIDHLANERRNPRRLVLPAITPRFIPSCTDPLLRGLGELAERYACHVQTHCSESDWEHDHVRMRTGMSDTHALEAVGLLGRRSILAHANLMDDRDLRTVAHCGAGIAHCPLSNAYFSNGVFPLRRAAGLGVRIGLGTDVAGGPSASLFDAARQAVMVSRLLETGVDTRRAAGKRGVSDSRIDFVHALHLATAGGADVLDLPIGRFQPGCRFDALLIDPQAPGSDIVNLSDRDSDQDLLQKTLYGATRANVRETWVDGLRR